MTTVDLPQNSTRPIKLTRVFYKPLQGPQRFFHHRPQFSVIYKHRQLFPWIPAKMKFEPPLDGKTVLVWVEELKPTSKLLAIEHLPVQLHSRRIRLPFVDPQLVRLHEGPGSGGRRRIAHIGQRGSIHKVVPSFPGLRIVHCRIDLRPL